MRSTAEATASAGSLDFALAPFAFDQATYPVGLEARYECEAGGSLGRVVVPATLTWPKPQK